MVAAIFVAVYIGASISGELKTGMAVLIVLLCYGAVMVLTLFLRPTRASRPVVGGTP